MKSFVLIIFYFFMVSCSQDEGSPVPGKAIDPITISDPENEETSNEDNLSFTYLALGDSYTIGQNVAVDQRWPNQLSTALNNNGIVVDTVKIIAQTGWTTGNLISAIDGTDPEGSFDMVSLLIGVNNQYQKRSMREFAAEFEILLNTAIRLAGGNKDKVFVLSIPDYSVTPFASGGDIEKIAKELEEYNAISKEMTLNYEIAYFDITPISLKAKSDSSFLASDGLHPSGKMYKEWIELIYNDIVDIINN